MPDLFSKIGYKFDSSGYLYPDSDNTPLSLFVVADLDSEDGIHLMREAVASLVSFVVFKRLLVLN